MKIPAPVKAKSQQRIALSFAGRNAKRLTGKTRIDTNFNC